MPTALVDGLRLRWDDEGAGEPPILLVHGWCCDASTLAAQRTFLAARHRVVAPDLPWHGASEAPAGRPSLDVVLRALAALCGQLGLARPVVVGHSMGGALALQLATRTAAAPRAVVLLDARIDGPGSPLAAAREKLVARLRGPDFRDVMRHFVTRRFSAPDDDAAIVGRVADLMAAAPQDVMVDLMTEMNATDYVADLRACPCAVLFVGAASPVVPLESIAAARPDAALARVVGAGHFFPLLVPDQVNAMLRRFLEQLAAR
jgi:pimeloyl-ACP methyl ester carboxylesterase